MLSMVLNSVCSRLQSSVFEYWSLSYLLCSLLPLQTWLFNVIQERQEWFKMSFQCIIYHVSFWSLRVWVCVFVMLHSHQSLFILQIKFSRNSWQSKRERERDVAFSRCRLARLSRLPFEISSSMLHYTTPCQVSVCLLASCEGTVFRQHSESHSETDTHRPWNIFHISVSSYAPAASNMLILFSSSRQLEYHCIFLLVCCTCTTIILCNVSNNPG